MEQESSHKFSRFKHHHLALIIIGIISVFEMDSVIFHLDKPMVRDSNAMGISSEIIEDLLRTGKGFFGVHHPTFSGGLTEETLESERIF